jgi:Rieske Fe-S protein
MTIRGQNIWKYPSECQRLAGVKGLVIVTALFCFALSGGCKKSPSVNSNVPLVTVNFTDDLSLPQYNNLTVVGGWMYVGGGYKGIILYRASTDQFMAYDRTCTYVPPSGVYGIVQVQAGGIFCIDSVCGSKFELLNGDPTHGPATLPLKQYTTSFDGQYLTVTN